MNQLRLKIFKTTNITFLLSSFFWVVCLFVQGQNKIKIDSLLHVLADPISDSRALEVYINLMSEYNENDSIQTFKYADKVILLSEILKMPNGKVDGFFSKGWVRMRYGNYSLAKEDFQLSLSLAEEANYTKGMANAYKGLGVVFMKNRDYQESEAFFMKSLNLNESLKDSSGIAAIYVNLGIISKEIGNLSQSLEHYLKALQYSNEDKYKFGCYYNIASLYALQNDLQNSLIYSEKALLMAKKVNNELMISAALRGLGQDNNSIGNYQKATDFLYQALSIDKKLKSRALIASSFSELSLVYFNQKEFARALAYCDSAYQLYQALDFQNQLVIPLYRKGKILSALGKWQDARSSLLQAKKIAFETKNIEYLSDVTSQLSLVSAKLGYFEEAYENHVIHKQMYDSLINTKNTKAITLLEANYQFQKERDSIQFANEKEKITLDQTIRSQRNFQYFIICGMLGLIVLVFILIVYYRSKQRANQLLKAQSQEIMRKNLALASLDQAKSRFFANISHELRTPLTLISAPLQNILNRGLDKPNTEEQLNLMLDSTNQLKVLIDDILNLSKLESDKINLKYSEIDIHSFFKRLVGGFESLADQLAIEYLLDLEQLPNDCLRLDVGKTEKVINNLLSNALKNTLKGGIVQLKVAKSADKLEIAVIDTGTGISKEDLPHIFDRYYQSSEKSIHFQGGSGIGLSIAKEFVKLMGGELTVNSTLGKGSTFSFKLPYDACTKRIETSQNDGFSEWSSTKQTEEFSPKTTKHRHKILVVEDHIEMKKFIKSLLVEDYIVETASNGKEALNYLFSNSVDLIISDVMMPEMDGFKLLSNLRENASYQDLPVIMLTALNDEHHKLKALSIGVDDYLPKPFSPEELLARVINMLTRYEVRQFLKSKDQANNSYEPLPIGSKKDLEFVSMLEEIILSELENEEFKIDNLAERFNQSERQFRRNVKKITGLSPKEYQFEVAMQKARELLESNTYENLTAVAYTVGIRNATRFAEYYFKRFGRNPKDYFVHY